MSIVNIFDQLSLGLKHKWVGLVVALQPSMGSAHISVGLKQRKLKNTTPRVIKAFMFFVKFLKQG